jgi:hypothetical protein
LFRLPPIAAQSSLDHRGEPGCGGGRLPRREGAVDPARQRELCLTVRAIRQVDRQLRPVRQVSASDGIDVLIQVAARLRRSRHLSSL